MRRQLLNGRKHLSVTYPVNPPFAFVRIFFNQADEEFEYVALEPTLKPDEKEKIAQIRARMEAMMGQEELPITAGTTLEQSPGASGVHAKAVPDGHRPL